MNLGHTAIFVTIADSDDHTLARFYRNLLGQDPIVDIPNVYTEFVLSGMRLGLFKPSDAHRTEFASASSGSMSLCIEVENLEAAIAHLTTLGYPPPGAIQHASHGREIYGYDPQNNRIILHESGGVVLG
ncbi:VOC family protein [Altericista sp. CCNU0014]|uniref:VOC family protein n=1 Tax=Altericista sp. CCNU0014 TaxID=3082949 RepID=UPI00384D0E98